jgi:membrane carboxypeptidase/penicillin-binding protein
MKNKKADGSKYDLDRDGLRIYTTINYKMQKYAEEAVAERIRDLQADFRRDLRSKTHKPFSNDKWALKSSTNVALSGNSVIAVLKNTDSFINFADVPGESCCNKGKQFRRKNLDNPKTKRL